MPNKNDWSYYAPGKFLEELDNAAKEELLCNLDQAVEASFFIDETTGLKISQFPEEGDLDEPDILRLFSPEEREVLKGVGFDTDALPDGSPASRPKYLLQHLLENVLTSSSTHETGCIPILKQILDKLDPEEFISLFTIYCQKHNWEISPDIKPLKALEAIRSYKRRRAGGMGKALSVREDEDRLARNEKIRKAHKEMLDAGQDPRSIASILAPRFELSASQIRRILKNCA